MPQLELLFVLICIIFCLVESAIGRINQYPILASRKRASHIERRLDGSEYVTTVTNPYPYYVRVGKSLTDSDEDLCGGVLISSTIIVSSAECFYFDSMNDLGQWEPRWAKNETEVIAYSGNFAEKTCNKFCQSYPAPKIEPLKVRYYVTHDKLALIVLEQPVEDAAYLRICKSTPHSETSNGFDAFALSKFAENFIDTKSTDIEPRKREVETRKSRKLKGKLINGLIWALKRMQMEWLKPEKLTYSARKDCVGAPKETDFTKYVCFESDNKSELKNFFRSGDPLVKHPESDEDRCLIGIGFWSNQSDFLFVRADWARDWIESKFGIKFGA